MSRIGEIQRSQLITTFGIGSIMDVKDYSVIMAGQEYWRENRLVVVREERLEKKLNVTMFKQPDFPIDRNDLCIPAFRFPEWVFCPRCKKLASYKQFGSNDVRKCPRCNVRLVPARFVISCENGHLDDFPWIWWVHRGEPCKRPNLKIGSTGRSTSLANIMVSCTNPDCNARRTLAGIFSKDALKGLGGCNGRRPWLGPDDREHCTSSLPPRVLQRGSACVYFPVTDSAISIPPYSERIHSFLRQFDDELKTIIPNVPDEILKGWLKAKLQSTGERFDLELLVMAAKERSEGIAEDRESDLKAEEYRALCNPGQKDPGAEFCAEEVDVPSAFRKWVARVVLVHRLREVSALTGFTRMKPGSGSICPLSLERRYWFPATEVRGEGIFIELDHDEIKRWVSRGSNGLVERIEKLERIRKHLVVAEQAWGFEKEITPRLLLVHTFAHLLIKQLMIDCGYSTSALRERIYVGDAGNGLSEMNGLLIYTATSDSEGSLGGLVLQGKVSRFATVLARALDKGRWCSNDPLCSESDGQGLNSLNLAACHSCSLLPETACEFRNCILDRATVIGTLDQPELGFFSN